MHISKLLQKKKNKESRGRESKKRERGRGGRKRVGVIGERERSRHSYHVHPSPLLSIVTECGRLITEGQRERKEDVRERERQRL